MSARLRVLQVLECGGPGGTGAQVAALCRGLAARFDLHLAYAVRPGCSAAEYENAARGAVCHPIDDMVRPISPLRDARAWLRLYRLLRELRPDAVHAHSSKAGFLARVAGLAAGVPLIYYSPRGYAFQQLDSPRAARALYRTLERSVSRIGRIVAVSESEAALARALAGGDRVSVIPDAYLGEVPAPAEPARGDAVCALGRLTYARRPESFVALARALAPEFPRARFVWIGDGELRPQFERLRREWGLEDRLELTGWLPHARALERLREAAAFVHFSRWEGLANAVIEAMVHGIPSVVSDLPSNRELIRDGQEGRVARDPAELAAAARDLLRDPAARARLGASARRRSLEEFSLERMLARYGELYAGRG